jgi:hypothetical protein
MTAMWSCQECVSNYEESIFGICCDLDKRLALCKEVLSFMTVTGTTLHNICLFPDLFDFMIGVRNCAWIKATLLFVVCFIINFCLSHSNMSVSYVITGKERRCNLAVTFTLSVFPYVGFL